MPVYNEEESIDEMLDLLLFNLKDFDIKHEIIIVNDCSKDKSLDLIHNYRNSHNIDNIVIIDLQKRMGKSIALLLAFDVAKYSIIATIDSDLQNDPSDIIKMHALLECNSAVLGYRAKRKDSISKIFSSLISNVIRKYILQDNVIDSGCPLKVFWKKDKYCIIPFIGSHRFYGTMFTYHKLNILQIEVKHYSRKYGCSKYGLIDRLFKTIPDLFAMLWIRRNYLTKYEGQYYKNENKLPYKIL